MHCRYSTLIEMLDMYKVKLNHTLQKMIRTYLILPGEDSLACSDELQQNLIQAHRQLKVEPETVLLLKRPVTMKILIKLVIELKIFIKPILSKVDFFVYFTLHNCDVFSKYLNYQLDMMSASQCPVNPSDVRLTIFPAHSQECFTEPDENMVKVYDKYDV